LRQGHCSWSTPPLSRALAPGSQRSQRRRARDFVLRLRSDLIDNWHVPGDPKARSAGRRRPTRHLRTVPTGHARRARNTRMPAPAGSHAVGFLGPPQCGPPIRSVDLRQHHDGNDEPKERRKQHQPDRQERVHAESVVGRQRNSKPAYVWRIAGASRARPHAPASPPRASQAKGSGCCNGKALSVKTRVTRLSPLAVFAPGCSLDQTGAGLCRGLPVGSQVLLVLLQRPSWRQLNRLRCGRPLTSSRGQTSCLRSKK
jgi:hypothetical protein